MPEDDQKDWKWLAEQVTKEQDPEKLSSLIKQLLQSLDSTHRPTRQNSSPAEDPPSILLVDDEDG
jgi:hypothetical protein